MAIKKTEQATEKAIAGLRAQGERYKKEKSDIMNRPQVGIFSGGTFGPRHLANLDCQNVGIPGGFYLGRQKVYPVDAVVDWLISRLEV